MKLEIDFIDIRLVFNKTRTIFIEDEEAAYDDEAGKNGQWITTEITLEKAKMFIRCVLFVYDFFDKDFVVSGLYTDEHGINWVCLDVISSNCVKMSTISDYPKDSTFKKPTQFVFIGKTFNEG